MRWIKEGMCHKIRRLERVAKLSYAHTPTYSTMPRACVSSATRSMVDRSSLLSVLTPTSKITLGACATLATAAGITSMFGERNHEQLMHLFDKTTLLMTFE